MRQFADASIRHCQPDRHGALAAITRSGDCRRERRHSVRACARRAHLSDERARVLAADIVTGRCEAARLDPGRAFRESAARESRSRRPPVLRLSLYQLLHRIACLRQRLWTMPWTWRAGAQPSAAGCVTRSCARRAQRQRLPLPPGPIPAPIAGRPGYLGITHSPRMARRALVRQARSRASSAGSAQPRDARLMLRANTLRAKKARSVAAALGPPAVKQPARMPRTLDVTAATPRSPDHDSFSDRSRRTKPRSREPRRGARPVTGARPVASREARPSAGADCATRHSVACDVRVRRSGRTTRRAAARVHPRGAGWRHRPIEFAAVFGGARRCAVFRHGTSRRDPDIRWLEARAPGSWHGIKSPSSNGGAPRAIMVDAFSMRLLERARRERGCRHALSPRQRSANSRTRSEASTHIVPFLDERGMLRTLPFAHGLEAFFAAALVRRP